MKIVFYSLLILTTTFVSCKKGYVFNSAKIVDKNTTFNTDEELVFELQTDAYYKGDKINPSKVTWIIKDASRIPVTPIEATPNGIRWKAPKPDTYSIEAKIYFEADEEKLETIITNTDVSASFNYNKQKLVGTFDNPDYVNPGFNFDLTINADNSITGKGSVGLMRGIFYNANNVFTGCNINIDKSDLNGVMSGTITVRDSATNTLRTDLIREMKWSYYYLKLSFKQLYANDTTQFRYFDLERK